jgi:hypothetical protein
LKLIAESADKAKSQEEPRQQPIVSLSQTRTDRTFLARFDQESAEPALAGALLNTQTLTRKNTTTTLITQEQHSKRPLPKTSVRKIETTRESSLDL